MGVLQRCGQSLHCKNGAESSQAVVYCLENLGSQNNQRKWGRDGGMWLRHPDTLQPQWQFFYGVMSFLPEGVLGTRSRGGGGRAGRPGHNKIKIQAKSLSCSGPQGLHFPTLVACSQPPSLTSVHSAEPLVGRQGGLGSCGGWVDVLLVGF